ncbi:MAG TPA: PHP domain-containing protein [Bdellovibrionota bacterium]|nr:PHP domain-containing protein [Bdellovibrionota bacterium]
MSQPEFAELCARTHYSFLRGASSPQEMVERARELGLRAIGVVDRDGVYGIPKAYDAARGTGTPSGSTRLIVGSELTLGFAQDPPATVGASSARGGVATSRRHLRLLAIDRAGYGLMCRLLSTSHMGSTTAATREKGDCWLDWAEFLRIIQAYPGAAGLIAMPAAPDLSQMPPRAELASAHQLPHWPQPLLGQLRELFPSRLYLPIGRFLDGWDKERTRAARELGIPLVATNEAHMHIPERRILQDVLTATRENLTVDDAGMKLFANAERYLKSPAQMARLFRDLPGALRSTLEIAERCTFSPSELRYRYPSEWIPSGYTAQRYLEELVWKGVKWRYPDGEPARVRELIGKELALIEQLGFADYFLTIWEIVEFAKERKILCQGRGSAANSVVCYVLGITAISPDTIQVLFERFISAERGEPPDIDVDFEHDRREEVIQHIYEKYGRERAGMVAAVITYRERSSRRDVMRALGHDPDNATPTAEADPRIPPLVEEIEGFPRHLSIHSGGFTLSADPIIETVPIEPARMEGRTIVQWDKDDLSLIGLLKVDVLALGMLSAMRRTFDYVNSSREVPLTIATTPQDDPETYRMIQAADTIGVFQIESRAQMNMLGRLQPRTFYDIVIQVAIVRPGPIQGGMVHPYLRRRRGLESSVSPHPKLEKILARTLGVPLFQEQVMAMAIELAGFTPGESDQLRRAVNAWKSKGSIEKIGKRLMDGLLSSGLSQEYVERIFQQIQGFAEYGFPESHAASFGLLAYVSSYLKAHYPAEFACALINSQPMGFYSTSSLIEDALRHGVDVRPLDPNRSGWDCELEKALTAATEVGARAQMQTARAKPGSPAIRLGFRVVNGISRAEVATLLAERARRPFANLPDFLSRTRLKPSVLHRLAMGEAFAQFGLKQRDALWQILGHAAMARDPLALGLQMDLFGPKFDPLTRIEAIQSDYQTYGLSLRGHPMQALRARAREVGAREVPSMTHLEARRAPDGSRVRVAGMVITRQRPPTAKGTVFATLEDEEGVLDLVLHKDVDERYHDVIRGSRFLVVTGRMQRDANTVTLVVDRVEALDLDRLLAPGGGPAEAPSAEFRTSSHDFR